MSLNIYTETSAPQPHTIDGGLQTLSEIERLQNHVLQELEDLDARIQNVFKAFGYRETEPENQAGGPSESFSAPAVDG